jgi:hypothetical protein
MYLDPTTYMSCSSAFLKEQSPTDASKLLLVCFGEHHNLIPVHERTVTRYRYMSGPMPSATWRQPFRHSQQPGCPCRQVCKTAFLASLKSARCIWSSGRRPARPRTVKRQDPTIQRPPMLSAYMQCSLSQLCYRILLAAYQATPCGPTPVVPIFTSIKQPHMSIHEA